MVSLRNPWFFVLLQPKDLERAKRSQTLMERTPLVAASVFHNFTVTALQEFSACIESGHTLFHWTTLVVGSFAGTGVACQKARLGTGMYYVHLIKREQLHVSRLEDIASDPCGTMDKVWNFLGVPPKLLAVKKIFTRIRGVNERMERTSQCFQKQGKCWLNFIAPTMWGWLNS